MKSPDDKLTLKLQRDSIQRAKAFAKTHGTSLSRLVEDYFDQISAPEVADAELPKNILSLMGILKAPKNFNPRQEYREHIIKKYSR
jgi:hypothetical protein